MYDAPVALFIVFVLGAVVASFVGVLAGRLYTGESIVRGRSHCDACGATLKALDLIPLLSWSFARGRCRTCRARIKGTGTLTELILGLLYVLAYAKLGPSLSFLVAAVFLALLLAIVLYDLAHQIIPVQFLLPLVICAVFFAILQYPLYQVWIVALAEAAILALIHVFSRGRAMGIADAPLAFALALFGGPSAPMGFILSFWIGAAVGIIILAGRPPGHRMGIEVPFAPFLACGFLLAYFSGWDPFFLSALLALG